VLEEKEGSTVFNLNKKRKKGKRRCRADLTEKRGKEGKGENG